MQQKFESKTSKKKMKVTLIGDTGVGKTSIVNMATRGKFDEDQKSTVGFDYHNKDPMQIWDIAGEKRFFPTNTALARHTDAIILVLDINKETETRLIIPKHIKQFLLARPLTAKLYIAVNKCDDEVDDSLKSAMINKVKLELKRITNEAGDDVTIDLEDEAIFFCSAKTGKNIDALFKKVVQDFIYSSTEQLVDTSPLSNLESTEPAKPNPFLTWGRNLKSHIKVWIAGDALILGGAALFFTLAAFTAGSFLTLGILPSAFIGAAILTGVAFLDWNLGCAIYHSCSKKNAPTFVDVNKSSSTMPQGSTSLDHPNASSGFTQSPFSYSKNNTTPPTPTSSTSNPNSTPHQPK